jgi:integrase
MKGYGLKLSPSTGIYRLDISEGGKRLQKSLRTSDLATAMQRRDEELARFRLDLAAEKIGGGKEWSDAVGAYIERARRKKNRAINDVRLQLDWLEPHLRGPLRDITADRISKTLREKEKQGVQRLIRGEWKRTRDVSPTTLNRYYSTISAVLQIALERGWITAVPRWERTREEARVEYLTREQWARLWAELPDHLRSLAAMAVNTGLRQKTITHLEWNHVDLERRRLMLPGSTQKNGKNLGVALSSTAMNVIEMQKGKHPRWVFPYQAAGKDVAPITQPAGMAWRKALVRAGLPRTFRWHSLRSTWVVWHLESGTPLEVVMRLGGWSRLDVLVKHYAHFSSGIADRYVNAVDMPPPSFTVQGKHPVSAAV